MECREFESNIQSFIKGELPDDQYDSFIEHYNSCSECNEELEILYLVHNTINSSEEDITSFNLKEKLKNHIKKTEDMVYRRYKYNFFRKALIVFAEIAAGTASIIFVLRFFIL